MRVKYIIFFVICLFIKSFSQSDNGFFLTEDLRYYAKKIIKVQMQVDELYNLKRFIQRDSLEIESKESLDNLYLFLGPSYKEDKDYVPIDNISIEEIYQTINGNLNIYMGYKNFDSHPDIYIVGINKFGPFFFLKGFPQNDFNLMIKNTLTEKTVSNQSLINIADLYLRTVKYEGLYERDIIIKTQNQIKKHQVQGVELPKVFLINGLYKIKINSISLSSKSIRSYEIDISRDGTVLNCIRKE